MIVRQLSSAVLVTLVGFSVSSRAKAPHNVLLAQNRTEPVVAVDPGRPNVIVAASNTDYSAPVGDTFPAGSFTSTDAGHSFAAGTVPILQPFTTEADTTINIADDGTVFLSYLGETPAYCSGGRSAIIVTHSIDHGRSYRSPVIVDSDPADDKPNMAIESFLHKPAHIFVSWTRWHASSSDIWYSRSVDGGVKFSHPARLQVSALDNFGTVPVIGAHHRVYVFWSVFPDGGTSRPMPTRIMVRASTDDGAHFKKPADVSGIILGVPRMTLPGSLRNFTMPAAVAGTDGVLFAAWAQVSHRYSDGHVDANIMVTRSVDTGQTWSRARQVNDRVAGDRFMPSMSLFADGSLGVAFYDRRRSTTAIDLFAARASFHHGFHAYRNVRVNRTRSSVSDISFIAPGSTCFSPGRFFGDYIGTAPRAARLLAVVWADTQLHRGGETQIWFSNVQLP